MLRACGPSLPSLLFHLVNGGPSRCNGLRSRGHAAFSRFGCQTARAGGFSRGRVLKDGVRARAATDGALSRFTWKQVRRLSLDTLISVPLFFLQETPISLLSTDILGRISGILERAAAIPLCCPLFDFYAECSRQYLSISTSQTRKVSVASGFFSSQKELKRNVFSLMASTAAEMLRVFSFFQYYSIWLKTTTSS